MKATELVLHGYAEQVDARVWQAFCLDLNLAAQGETCQEAHQKLLSMVVSYLEDALLGEDQEHAAELLSRKAPLKFWLKYYWFALCFKVGRLQDSIRVLFRDPLPLTVSHGH